MRTRKFKSQRGWLDFVARRGAHGERRVYEPLNDFFAREKEYHYFVHYGEPGREHYNHETVSVPWEWKYQFAEQIVNFHWKRKSKSEREWIATNLAKGEGDLSMLQSFQLELRRNGSKWEYDFCTSSLSGPNYDWCKRMYLRSL